MNITTEKVDTKEFLAEIRKIKPEVSVKTETVNVDMKPVMEAIKTIGKISDIKFPEEKEIDMSDIKDSLVNIEESILSLKE